VDPRQGYDLQRYRGSLKSMHTAGMIGGNAGCYAHPKGNEQTTLQGIRPALSA
jgi:hypothetical protein